MGVAFKSAGLEQTITHEVPLSLARETYHEAAGALPIDTLQVPNP